MRDTSSCRRARLRNFQGSTGPLEAGASTKNTPAVLFDAIVLPEGSAASALLLRIGKKMYLVKDQYRHCKSIRALGASSALLAKAGIEAPLSNGTEDPGLFIGGVGLLDDFIRVIGKYRHPQRDLDPPFV